MTQESNLNYQYSSLFEHDTFQQNISREEKEKSEVYCSDILFKNTFSHATSADTADRSRGNSITNLTQLSREIPTNEELLAELKQLKENQSALLDRLAERDQHIFNL